MGRHGNSLVDLHIRGRENRVGYDISSTMTCTSEEFSS